MPGKGKILVTGNLKSVMQESAAAAMSFVRSHAAQLGLDPEFLKTHRPAPPRAEGRHAEGRAVAPASRCSRRSRRCSSARRCASDVAMTGEISLRGAVLPVGGIKEKLLAAHRAGIKEIVMPVRNEKDLEDVPKDILAELKIHLVKNISEVLPIVLEPPPAGGYGADGSPRRRTRLRRRRASRALQRSHDGSDDAPRCARSRTRARACSSLVALGAVGFLPLFGGPGYEQSLATGLLVPSAAAIAIALDARARASARRSRRSRAASCSGSRSRASRCSRRCSTPRASAICELWGALLYFALTSGDRLRDGRRVGRRRRRDGRGDGASRARRAAAPSRGARRRAVARGARRLRGDQRRSLHHGADDLRLRPVRRLLQRHALRHRDRRRPAMLTYRAGSLATICAVALLRLGARAPRRQAVRSRARPAQRGHARRAPRSASSRMLASVGDHPRGHQARALQHRGVDRQGPRRREARRALRRRLSVDHARAGGEPPREGLRRGDRRRREAPRRDGARARARVLLPRRRGQEAPHGRRAHVHREAVARGGVPPARRLSTSRARPRARARHRRQLRSWPVQDCRPARRAHPEPGAHRGRRGRGVPRRRGPHRRAVGTRDDADRDPARHAARVLARLPRRRVGEELHARGRVHHVGRRALRLRRGARVVRRRRRHGAHEARLARARRGVQGRSPKVPLPDEAESFARAKFARPGIFGRKCPHVVDALRHEADVCRDTQRYEEAIRLYREAIAKDAHDFASQKELATVQRRHGDREQGRAALTRWRTPTRRRCRARTRTAPRRRSPTRSSSTATTTAPRRATRSSRSAPSTRTSARTLEIKALGARDPEARDVVRGLLLGDEKHGPDIFWGGVELGAWSARHRSGLASYLVGRNFVGRGFYELGAKWLDEALELPLPDAARRARDAAPARGRGVRARAIRRRSRRCGRASRAPTTRSRARRAGGAKRRFE